MSAGGEILTGQQEEHAREIAKQEVASFARLLADELAMVLWRHSWPGQVAGATSAAQSLSEAFRAFSVPVKEASTRLERLNALLASDPERRV